ncbi:MAG TPA: hypothetical protein VGN42_25630 [Pirellulales bacterium]|jgi:hypothetical protein|nr:hypothetical protein [Pirellulales bacterium]
MSATLPAVLDRFLDPITECLTPDVAERILKSRPDSRLQARIDQLADKANNGLLSDGERDEYRDIVEAIDVVGIIKAKARAALVRRE